MLFKKRTYLHTNTEISIELKLSMDLYTQSVLSSTVWWYFRFSVEFCVPFSIEIGRSTVRVRNQRKYLTFNAPNIQNPGIVLNCWRIYISSSRTILMHHIPHTTQWLIVLAMNGCFGCSRLWTVDVYTEHLLRFDHLRKNVLYSSGN